MIDGYLFDCLSYASHRATWSSLSNVNHQAILREFYNMRFQAEDESWPNFAKRVPVLGCIVEEFIEGQVDLLN